MFASYVRLVCFVFRANILWPSSSMYQCFLLPLLLSAAVLGWGGGGRKALPPLLGKLALVFCGGLLAYCLVVPLFRGFMMVGVATHVLLLLCIALCAVFLSPLRAHVRAVVAAALVSELNWAFSISAILLFPLMPLGTANLLQFGLIFLACALIFRFKPAAQDHIPAAYWTAMLLIAVLSAVCLFTVRILEGNDFYRGANYATLRVILPAFFAVSLLMYYLYHVLTEEHRRSSEMAALQTRQERDVELYQRTETLCRELQGLRHELRNHIAVMDALLREEQYDQLRDYFAAFVRQGDPVLDEFHCPNALVSSVLTHKMSEARAAGLRLDAVAAVPERLGVADADLCSLLSNLLDNAVEGCQSAGGGCVKATLHTEKGYLFLTVTNPAPPDVLEKNPGLATTKSRRGAHGFGVPIIRRIADKYDGCVTFGVEDGRFIADVMLLLEEG